MFMTVAELQAKIKELGFPDTYFSFNGKEAWGINLCFDDACDFADGIIMKSAKYFSKK